MLDVLKVVLGHNAECIFPCFWYLQIGGGSLRIYKREVQQKVLEIVGISSEQVRRPSGYLNFGGHASMFIMCMIYVMVSRTSFLFLFLSALFHPLLNKCLLLERNIHGLVYYVMMMNSETLEIIAKSKLLKLDFNAMFGWKED